jgi:hypothetical protein
LDAEVMSDDKERNTGKILCISFLQHKLEYAMFKNYTAAL